ncbi:MAG TPA: hypothetical protein PKD91_14850 [Bacteroidia bacterium]|nr:hypothetical protein [Bacteroidia bacterium]
MKTGEEKFDDEIRQKLRHSEVKPPVDFFNHILPPPNKKRGFIWLWLFGILFLGSTVLVMNYNSSFKSTAIDNQVKSGAVKSNSNSFKSKYNETAVISSQNTEVSTVSSGRALENSVSKSTVSPMVEKDTDRDRSRDEGFNYSDKNKKNKSNSNFRKDKNLPSETYFVYNDRKKNPSDELLYNYDFLINPTSSLPFTNDSIFTQHIKTIPPSVVEFDPHEATSFSFELFVSRVMYDNQRSSDSNDTLAARLLNARDQIENKISGLEAGIKILYALNTKFTAGIGLNYATRTDEFHFHFTDYYKTLEIDTIQYYILFPFSPPLLMTEIDSSIITASATIPINHKITYHTFSVSAELRYAVPLRRFLIEPMIGLNADVYTDLNGETNFNTKYLQTSGEEHFQKSLQTRVKGGIQAGYLLNEKINVFINSEYQYGLNSMVTSDEFYKEKNNRLSIGVGIKYNFFKKQAAKTE